MNQSTESANRWFARKDLTWGTGYKGGEEVNGQMANAEAREICNSRRLPAQPGQEARGGGGFTSTWGWSAAAGAAKMGLRGGSWGRGGAASTDRNTGSSPERRGVLWFLPTAHRPSSCQ